MPLAVVHSRALVGLDAPAVSVEVHIGVGLPAFHIVGLPEAEVRESRDRVRAALLHAGFDFPNRRLTVNLAPADLPKASGRFDLPIAVGILAASEQVPANALDDLEFVGELSLTGAIRPIRGALAMALAVAREAHERSLLLPAANGDEAALVDGVRLLAAEDLVGVAAHLSGSSPLVRIEPGVLHAACAASDDLADVKGQPFAKRALEVAAAGAHNLLMIGPPGSGKSLLAHRMPTIQPPMDTAEALESAALASLHGAFRTEHWGRRPFRAPHHGASAAAIVGGGSNPRPGGQTLSYAHTRCMANQRLSKRANKVRATLSSKLCTTFEAPRGAGRERRPLLVFAGRRRTEQNPFGKFLAISGLCPSACAATGLLAKTMQNGSNAGLYALFAGRLSVASVVEAV
jgi:magnesium chelatase family protein